MQIPDIRFWAGTEESLAAYISALKTVAGLDVQAYYKDNATTSTEQPTSRLLTTQGNVGVVSISGSLVPGEPWYAAYAGVTGYGEIRAALVEAANNPDIGAIVLDINSGGGAVSGVSDVADLISNIDANVKPVHTFSDGMIASAAYWLGSSARDITIGQVAEAGSIGVLTVHKEITKAMDMNGIKATVIRSGEYKALGNSMEKLTAKAEAVIQEQVDQMDQLFISHVAPKRGMSVAQATEKIGQGRVFIGDRAVAAGLVDSVSNFDAVVSKIQGEIDSQKQRSQYGGNFSKGPVVKTALTEQQLAALAEGGAALADAGAPTEAVEGAGSPAPAAVIPAVEPTAAAAPEAAPAQAAPAGGELVAFLQSQLAASQAQVLDLTVEVRDLKADADKKQGVHASLRALAEASVDRLKVALGGTGGTAAGLSDEALLAEHATLRASFETKFKVGGVAAVSSSGSSEKSAAVEDPVRMRRVQATRLSK